MVANANISVNKESIENYSLSYTVGIPAVLLDDTNLSDRQFRLMIHLIGLARKEGYCWASDQYLSKKMNISIRQIQREISYLHENGYIERHTTKEGMKSVRSIYVGSSFSRKVYGTTPVSSSGSHPCRPRGVTGVVPISKATNIIRKRESPNSKSSDDPPIFSKFSSALVTACEHLIEHVFSLPVKSYDPRKSDRTWFNWLDSMRKIVELDKRSLAEITEMIDYIHNDDFWDINVRSPQKLREKWIEIDLQKKKKVSKPSKEERVEQNRSYALQVIKTLKKNLIPKEVKLEAHNTYLEFGSHKYPQTKILKYSENCFKNQVEHELRRRNVLKHLT